MKASPYKHPKALPYLFLTEMWERFGFYVAQGFLVLYMTEHFGLSDDATYTISGLFSALVYISPFIGGFIADRMLGFRTVIIYGGLFLIAGYGLLAISGTLFMFYLGLATIIVGNGFFKPNISSLLGTQYAADNPKRDSGFTIFYIGINIGVAFSGLTGYVKDAYGWHATYALASIGMFIGLMTFLYGMRYLKNEHVFKTSTTFKLKFLAGCIITILIINALLHLSWLTNLFLPLSGILLLALLVGIIYKQNKTNRRRMLVLSTLILSSIVFWMLFLQLFNSANLYVSRLVEQNLFGIPLTPTVFWGSESVFIFILGPLFAWMWNTLGAKHQNPAAMHKFILGILFTSAGFVVLAFSTYFPNSTQQIPAGWVFGAYFLITIGELLISPVGLSAVTSLAPEHLVGMMMGVWFVATGFGGYFAGLIAQLASVPADTQIVEQKLAIYQTAFFSYAAFALAVATLLFILQLVINRGKKDPKLFAH